MAHDATDVFEGGTVLFESNSDGPLRMVSALALVFAIGSFLLAAMLLDTEVTLGNGISGHERAVWAGGLMLLLVGFWTGLGFYRRQLASKIVLSKDEKTLQVETPNFFGRGTTLIPIKDVVRSQYHGGDKRGEEALSSPWLRVYVRNQRSFLVPLTGPLPNKDRLIQVLNSTR